MDMEKKELIEQFGEILRKTKSHQMLFSWQYLCLDSRETYCPRQLILTEDSDIRVVCGVFEPTEKDEEQYNNFPTFASMLKFMKLERNTKVLDIDELSLEDLKLIKTLIEDNQ